MESRINQKIHQHKTNRAHAFLIFFTSIAIIFSMVLFFALYFLKPSLLAISNLTAQDLHSSYDYIYIIPIIAIFSMLAQTINCTTYRNLAGIANKLAFPLTFLIITIIFASDYYSKSLNRVYISYGVTYLALTAIIAAITISLIKSQKKTKRHHYEIKTWLKSTLPLLVNQLLLAAVIQIDLIILEIYAFNENTVGVFAALITLTTSYWIIIGAQQFRYTPEISILIQNEQHSKLQNIVNKYNTSTLFYTAPLMILTILFPTHILTWLDPRLTSYYVPFWVLSTCIWLFSPGSLYNTILAISKHRKISVYINLAALILLCITEIILVPRYQLWGAIIPIAASRFFISFCSNYYCRRHFGLKYF